MRRSLLHLCLCLCAALPACTRGDAAVDLPRLTEEVMLTERAFARTMADRDSAAFADFVSDEAIFFSGETVQRGREAITAAWRPFFEGPTPPFSWDPDRVEVLESGALALSTGLVRNPEDVVIGRFNSIWRREPAGQWKIVFDKGSPAS